MNEKETGLPENLENTPDTGEEEPMADAMSYSTHAKQERAKQERANQAKKAEAARRTQESKEKAHAKTEQKHPQEDHRAPESRHASKKKRRRKKGEFDEKNDPYYGLKLKSRDEYQREYEQTLSFKPVKPEDAKKAPSEPTGTFTYLFDGSQPPSEEDKALQKRFEKLHEERRRRVEEVIHQTGTVDVAKADIFNITTAVSLDEIRKAAEKRGVDPSKLPRAATHQDARQPDEKAPAQEPEKPHSTPAAAPTPPAVQEPTVRLPQPRLATYQAVPQPDKKAPVREPEKPHSTPAAAPTPPAIQEPIARPPQPRIAPNQPVSYRPSGTPIHVVELDDLMLPIFNEAKGYRRNTPKPARAVPPPRAIVDRQAPKPEAAKPEAPKPEAAKLEEAPPKTEKPVPDNITPLPVRGKIEPEPMDLPAQESPFARHTVEGAAEVRDAAPEETPQPKRRRLFQHSYEELLPPDERDDHAAPQAEEELPPNVEDDTELEDYNSPDDAPAVFNDLGGKLRELMLRLSVTGIATVLQVIFGVLGEYGIGGLPPINITAYLICSLVFLGVPVVFCHATVLNGLRALFRFRANADSAVAVASVVGIVQEVTALFNQSAYQHGTMHLYALIVTAALFLNTCGKFLMVRRINRNFHFVASPEKIYSAEKFDDHNIALQLAEGCTLNRPAIVYQRETGFLKHFLRLSYSDDPSDRSSQFLAPVLFCASLVLFIVNLLLTKDVMNALAAFAAATCVSTPLMNMLSVNLPLARVSRVATQCGGMVVGFPAVQYYSDANAIMVDASDLFPKGTVTLNGIKTFSGQQIDSALVDAAALMHQAGGPLESMFSQILRSRQDMPKVENVQYEDGMGLSGWVGGRRILMGNRRLLIAHSVTPPDESLEQKYLQGGKQFTYLAVGGKLIAMFIMTYQPDRHRATELLRMEDNGISLIVRSNDPNVTAPFLSAVFHLDVHTVRVLPERLGQVYVSRTRKPSEAANTLIATRGRPTALMRLVTACVRIRGNITIAVVMQTVSAILGFALVAFLSCQSGGITQVSTLGLTLYELFWSIAIWLIPKLHKP